MDPAEHLPGLDHAPRRSLPQPAQRVAARTVDPREAEDMYRQAGSAMERQPALLGRDPAAAALAGRRERARFVDPTALAVAIHAGRREIADPACAARPGE